MTNQFTEYTGTGQQFHDLANTNSFNHNKNNFTQANNMTNSTLDQQNFSNLKVKLSLVDNIKDNSPKDIELSIGALEELFTTFSEDVISKYQARAVVAGHFGGKKRKEENLLLRSLIILDIDKFNGDISDLERSIELNLNSYRYNSSFNIFAYSRCS